MLQLVIVLNQTIPEMKMFHVRETARGAEPPGVLSGPGSVGRTAGRQTEISDCNRSLASMYSSTMENTTSLAFRTVVARPIT